MKLYALALSAQKDRMTQIRAGVTMAASPAEAIGNGIVIAKEYWPQEQNWHSHGSTICEIPGRLVATVALVDEMIEVALQEQGRGEEGEESGGP